MEWGGQTGGSAVRQTSDEGGFCPSGNRVGESRDHPVWVEVKGFADR